MTVPKPLYGHGLGHGSHIPYRHRQARRRFDPIMGITKPAIRRLARRGGIIRIQRDIYDCVRQVLKLRLKEIIERLVIVLGHPTMRGPKQIAPLSNARKTVTTQDVVFVLRQMGTPIYGFDNPHSNVAALPWKA